MIFRIIYAVIYSALVVILTGIPQAALAVVSCQDTINPNTNIRYSDALVSFKAYNGRTYAIAKSAATGGTSAAESFFDFLANITRAYAMTGDSTGSLKNLLSLGQYGAATPVQIDSADTKQFILTQFGKYLGTASTPQSTYINAWKEYGSGGFSAIDGTALSYTNWVSPVYVGQDPQAVVMGADGTWSSGLDGARSSQIVQFDGTLDCAVTFPSPGSGTTTTTPPTGSTTSTGPDLSKPVCGQDLKGDGYAGDPGDTANCLQTAQGLFCPVGSVDCVESYSAPVCPAGSTLNTSRDMCQAVATVTCGAGYTYDASLDKCVEPVTCPDGGTFNPVTDQCEKLVMNQCPAGYTYDSTLDVCRMSADCSGGTLNPTKDRCEIPPTWNCPTGFTYNATSGKCEASPYCPTGTTYNASRDRCEAPLGSCPAGYTYNMVLDKCTAAVSCPSGGSLNGTTDKCEISSSISCPSGTIYNPATGKCEASPTCASPGSYNPVYDLCLTPSTGTTCPTGYTYNATYGSCIASPSCVGGIYNSTTDRCEVASTYSCSDASYVFNAGTGRCEKAPACNQGTYNTTYNVCLQSISHTCPSGYTYNSTTGRCEISPQCSVGTFNPVTNQCEYGAVCVQGTLNSVTGKCDMIVNAPVSLYTNRSPYCYYDYNNPYCNPGYVLNNDGYGDYTCEGCLTSSLYCDDGNGGYYPCSYYTCSDNVQYPYLCQQIDRGCHFGPTAWGMSFSSSGGTGTFTNNACGDPDVGVVKDAYVQYRCGGSIYTTYSGENRSATISCPTNDFLWIDGYYYTSSDGMTVCPAGTTPQIDYKGWATQCTYTSSNEAQNNPTCSYGGNLQGTKCQVNPTCPGGSFDYTAHVCYAAYTPTCPIGTTYDSSIGSCTVAPTCTNGLLDGNQDVCYQSATTGCPSGYILSGSVCTATPSCASGGALDGSIDFCKAAPTWNCPTGYSFSGTYGQCYRTVNCGAGSLNSSLDICQQSYSLTCPSGYALNGTTCQTSPSCVAGGSYNASLDLCDGGSNVCSPPLALDTSVDTCYQPASCSGGTLNAATDKCEAAPTVNCGAWSWDSAALVCYSPPVCNLGAYDVTADECRATVTKNCGTYGWSSSQGKCTWQIVCPKDGSYSLSNTVVYSTTLDECVSDAQHTCPAGTAYNGLPIEKCEAIPICTGNGIYNSTVHSCFLGMNTCPLGTQYMCMNNQGTMQCSPNQCFTAGTSGTEQTTTMDQSMMQNDGQVDQNGNCLDQLYVFNGKASRCRPPGLTVGEINNCCDSNKVGSDDMGSNISTAANGIQTAYELGQVAYYGNALAAGTAQIASITTTASGTVTGMTVVTASGSTATLSGATATGAYGALASGASGAEAVSAGITEYVGALLNPATIVVALVVMAVMKVLMGNGCDQGDIQTGMQAASKDCHYIGDYCEKKWPLVGCIQKAKGYCCFNTKMARIIHEQGRPQLQSFGADGGWGSPNAPNCRGFTPEEFQDLDFSRIDLSEYFGDIEQNLGTEIQGAQTTIQNKVQQQFQATTGAK